MTDAAAVTLGLPSLDYIIDGGFAGKRCHLIEGEPGSGKTTLAKQLFRQTETRREVPVHHDLGSPFELRQVAASHGLSEVRLLAHGALRYRRQVLALKHFFFRQNCTA